MAEKKVTIMVLKVDLQSPNCYKKVKKLLYKFPQIRNQIFDEKQNMVTITVVCPGPEKIRDKLCCKGGKTIKHIQILEPPAPAPPSPPSPPLAPAPSPVRVMVHAPELPSLQAASQDISSQSVARPGPRAVDRRLNLTKITMIFCLGVAGEMAVQTRTENPWSFYSLCLLLMLARSSSPPPSNLCSAPRLGCSRALPRSLALRASS